MIIFMSILQMRKLNLEGRFGDLLRSHKSRSSRCVLWNPRPQGQRSGRALPPLSQRPAFSHAGLASFCRVHLACSPHVWPLGAEYFLSLSGWGGGDDAEHPPRRGTLGACDAREGPLSLTQVLGETWQAGSVPASPSQRWVGIRASLPSLNLPPGGEMETGSSLQDDVPDRRRTGA